MNEMISYRLLEKNGVLPIKGKEVNFAIGDPSGLTSNSWKIWQHNASVYIACRDNFKVAKVSLHPNNWRMAFTEESNLIMTHGDRTWEEWFLTHDQITNTNVAFRLVFARSDLVIRPELRNGRQWKNVIFIEAPPEHKLTVISLSIVEGDLRITHESEPSFCLASFDLGNNKFAKIITHAWPEGDLPILKEKLIQFIIKQCQEKKIQIPKSAYQYSLGHRDDGSRYLYGTPINNYKPTD